MLQKLKKLFSPADEPCPSCELRRKAMISTHDILVSSRAAHAGLSRRVTNLQKEQPEIWRLYFTRAGDEERNARKVA